MSSGIIRIEHDRDRPYVVVSKALSEDRRLSFALRGVLVYLLGKRDDWTTYMTEVEAAGAEGREAMKAIFAEGRKFGYIRTIEHREKGRLSYEHVIYERPLETPVPEILTPDGKPSSVLKRQQKAASAPKKTKGKTPSTGSRQREAVNGQPSTETRQVISNDQPSNDQQVNKREEAPAAPALEDPQEAGQETAGTQTPVEVTPGLPDPSEATADPVQVEPSIPGRQDDQATDTEDVPRAAAAGRTAEERAETETYLRRKLSSKFVTSLLEEIQPLGVDRAQDWFDIPLDRVKALMTEAVNTHDKFDVKVPTRLRDLLDEECRRKNVPFTPSTAPAPLDDDGEVDMDALMASAPRNGTARRAR